MCGVVYRHIFAVMVRFRRERLVGVGRSKYHCSGREVECVLPPVVYVRHETLSSMVRGKRKGARLGRLGGDPRDERVFSRVLSRVQ